MSTICAEDLAVESSPCEIRRLFAHIGKFSIKTLSSAKGALSCRSVAHLILEQKNDCFPYLKHLYCIQAMEQCLSLVLLLNCLFFGRGRSFLETFAECKIAMILPFEVRPISQSGCNHMEKSTTLRRSIEA